MRNSRGRGWLTLIVVGVGLIFVAVPAIWVYMSATATLHTSAQEAPSVATGAPAENWAYAVEQGRQIARSNLGSNPSAFSWMARAR